MFSTSDLPAPRLRLALALAAPALVVAACGGSSSSTSGPRASTAPAGSTAQTVTVETRSGDLGTFVTDGSGRTLYLFAADHGGTSACTGACLSAWPPLTTSGTPSAGGQVQAGMLGTLSRGGSLQVTYAGHPLYYYAGDSSTGDTNGQGVDGFGATWWVVSPAGTAITHSPGGGTPASGGSPGSGGYGYGSGGWG